MRYMISTITDMVWNDETDDLAYASYADRTEPLAREYGMGLELAEFSITNNMDDGFETALPHVEKCAAAVELKALHAPYNELFPMAIDPKVVDIAYERYDAAWRYCLRFGASKMIVHANYVEDLYFPSWFTQRHVAFWQRFLSEHPENVTICIENVMEQKPELLLPILEEVNDPRLRMCLDVGHANLSKVAPIDWLKACAPFISHYHIHNNNGRLTEGNGSVDDKHAALDNGTIDMLALLKTAEILTPDATAAIESYYPEDCACWLRENGFV